MATLGKRRFRALQLVRQNLNLSDVARRLRVEVRLDGTMAARWEGKRVEIAPCPIRPPYYVRLYDGSFLRGEQRTVAWLRAKRPNVVVYNVKRQDVFGVLDVVRTPLSSNTSS